MTDIEIKREIVKQPREIDKETQKEERGTTGQSSRIYVDKATREVKQTSSRENHLGDLL